MAKTRNVSVRITTEGVTRSGQEIEQFGDRSADSLGKIESAVGKIARIGGALIGISAAIVAGRNLIGFIDDVIESAGRIADVSDQLGIGAQRLQEFELAARAAGIENEKFEGALSKLNVKLGDAKQGNESALKSFEALGISWRELQTLDTEGAFLALADAIAKVEDPAKRAALLGDLLGDKLGPRFQAFLAQGGKAIDDYGKQWTRLGGTLDDEATKKADEVGDALAEMGSVLVTQARNIVIELLPAAETIRSWTVAIAGFFEEAIDGFRRFFGLAPDFDDTLDQIKERALELVDAKQKLAELQAEQDRVAREQPGAMLALKADTAKAESVVRGIEAEIAKLRARADELTAEQRRLQERHDDSGGTTLATLPPPSDSELKRRIAEREREAASLQALRHQLDPLTAANDNLNESLARLAASDLPDKAALMAAAYVKWGEETDRLTGKTKEAAEAEKARQKVMDAGRQVFEETRTAAEAYEAEFERLIELWRLGAISNDTLSRGVAKAGKELEDSLKDKEDLVEQLTEAFEGFGRRTAKALADVAVGLDDANASAKDLLQTLASEVLEQLIYKTITGPLSSGFSDALGELFGGTNWFGLAKGGVLSQGRLHAFAEGGVVTRPTLFPMANGVGLMGEAGEEAVMPLSRGPDGRLGVDARGGTGVVINIFDQRSGNTAPVQARERSGRDGRREIDIYIADSIERAMGQGRLDGALGRSFGAVRVPGVMRG